MANWEDIMKLLQWVEADGYVMLQMQKGEEGRVRNWREDQRQDHW